VDSALVVVGLALVLVVQIAIHLRIAGIPARVAMLKRAAEERTRPADDAFQEALARRLNLIVRGVQGYHDQIAEDFRIQVAAGEQRARLAEGKRDDATGVATELRALAREMSGIAAELRALQGDFAELVCAAAEALAARPVTAPVTPKAASTSEDPEERKTIEMSPPASCAPPAAAPCAAAANDGTEEGWDDPEEKTKLFSKDAVPSAVLVALRPPAAAKGARAARHALRPPPPPMAEEDDDEAPERPSILPEARTNRGAS
jgi:hypothetical protein